VTVALGLLWMGLDPEKKCLFCPRALESTPSEDTHSPAAAGIMEQVAVNVGKQRNHGT